eukprot:378988_1
MAAEKKTDDNLKYEDIIDPKQEIEQIKQMIEISLSPPDNTWTKHDTKDNTISVVYKQIGDSNVYTVRGELTMKGDIDSYHKHQECGYEDVILNQSKRMRIVQKPRF